MSAETTQRTRRPALYKFVIYERSGDDWLETTRPTFDSDQAVEELDDLRRKHPSREWRLARRTTIEEWLDV